MNHQKKTFNHRLKFITFLSLSITLTTLFNYPLAMVKADSTHEHHNTTTSDHSHKMLDISNLSNIPTLKVEIFPDKVRGWNLYLNTTNFEFISPTIENSNPNQGHAHLYINGEKVSRIYGNWFYLPELKTGNNEIKVTLNTNNHQDLIYNGKVISDRTLIENKK